MLCKIVFILDRKNKIKIAAHGMAGGVHMEDLQMTIKPFGS